MLLQPEVGLGKLVCRHLVAMFAVGLSSTVSGSCPLPIASAGGSPQHENIPIALELDHLTFWHSLHSISTTGWSVSLGRRNLEGIEPNEVALPVAEIILHPLFDNQIFDNDIALLRLSSAVEFNAFVRPVCLAANTSVFNNGTESWVTGWGSVQQGGEVLLR